MHRPSLVLTVSMLALAMLASAPRAWAQTDAGDTTDSGVPRPPRPPAHPDTPTIIPHNLEGRADCIGCHGPAGKHPFPSDHQERPSVACLACHVPSQSSRAQVPNTPVPPAVTNDFCFACHEKPALKMKLPGGQELGLFIDRRIYSKAMHGRKQMSCTACHPGNQVYPHEPFKGQVARELNRSIVQQRCAACHAELFAKYKESVHGKALLEEGNLDVPSCTDCHGIHNMRDPETVLFRVDSPDTCSKCHSDAKLMGKYGISPNVSKTYLADFHGTTVRLGRKEGTPEIGVYKAVCYDCHGIHDIKKTDDSDVARGEGEPRRDVPPLPRQRRHELPRGVDGPLRARPQEQVVGRLLGELLLQARDPRDPRWNGVLYLARARSRDRGEVEALEATMSGHEKTEGGGRTFVRFNLSTRLEHLVQIFGFCALCVTGIPQRFNGADWADSMIQAMGGIDVVRGIHRTFGVVLIAECVYHFGAILYALAVKRVRWTMMPGLQDLKDAGQMVLFFVGRRKERARFDR